VELSKGALNAKAAEGTHAIAAKNVKCIKKI
jgi:hypothetical protein